MSVLNFSLLRIFQGYLVICCLIINVLCFCCLATAILDYHISFRLSTTFFIFFEIFFEILFSVIPFCLFEPLLCSPHLSATNVILSCLFLIVNTFYIFYFICTIGTIRPPIAIISYLLSLKDWPKIKFSFSSDVPVHSTPSAIVNTFKIIDK